MLRDAGVRAKLLAVLAIPTLLLVVVTTLLVGGQVSAARQAGQVHALTDVAVQVNRVVHSLQEERSATLSYLQDPASGNRARMKGQRQFTDQQLRTLRRLVAESPVAAMSAAVQAGVARSTAGHGEIAGARRSVDAGRFFTTETDVFYSKVIRTDLDLPGVLASSGTPALAQRLQAYEAVSTAIEYASHERDIVETALLRGTMTEADFAQAAALVSQQRSSLADFQRSAPPAAFATLSDALASAQNTEIDKVRRNLTDLLKGKGPDYGRSVEWVGAANSRIGPMTDTESDVVSGIAILAAHTQGSQEQRTLLLVVGAVLGLLLALLLAVNLARRITRPLRRLTVAAGEIGDELPRMVERMQIPGEGPGVVVEPIPVESTDEIGRLAEAFNTVNDVTVEVAKEQAALRASIAEMFVNVARRNQVLLGRQLSQLDQMESREEDADVLASLYTLDHLATRMRRNAESLLVLAGIDSTRRLRRSLPLSDVIRTAVGEIEAYDRIDLSMSEDPHVSGRHALTVAHLLAELLENATHFSNPETRVVVSASVTGHGVDLTVTDYGLGMSDEEVAEANEKIAHPPVAEIAVSQRLGLFVVGRLAARLGASVVLRRGRTAGLVVSIALPASAFDGMPAAPPAQEDQSATAPLGAVGPGADRDTAVEPPSSGQESRQESRQEPVHVNAGLPYPPPVQTGAAMVPDLASSGTALPSRRSSVAPVDTEGVQPATASAATADVAPLADVAAQPPLVEDAVAAPAPAAGGPVEGASDPDEAVPPARRGLFARWSRTPSTGEPVGGTPDSLVDGGSVDGAVDDGSVDDGANDGSRVELLDVEVPDDESSVELEVAMVPVHLPLPTPAEDADHGEQGDLGAPVEPVEPVEPGQPVEHVDHVETPPAPAAGALDPASDSDRPKRRRRFGRRGASSVPGTSSTTNGPSRPNEPNEPNDQLEPTEETVEPAAEVEALPGPTADAPADVVPLDVAQPVAAVEVEVQPETAVLPVEPSADDEVGRVAEVDSVEPSRGVEVEPAAEVLPEPEPEPEPEPAPAPVVYAKAVDILPSAPARGSGMFGRHRRPTPVPATPQPHAARPSAPVAPPVSSAPTVDPVPSAPVATGLVSPAPAAAAPVAPTAVAGPALPVRGALADDLLGPHLPARPAPTEDAPPRQAPEPTVDPVRPARPAAELDGVASRADLHTSALSELRGLYEPSFTPAAAPDPAADAGGLTRRTPKPVTDAAVPPPPAPPARTRSAAEVRGMLAGFRAGVERGRGSAPADVDPDAGPDLDDPAR